MNTNLRISITSVLEATPIPECKEFWGFSEDCTREELQSGILATLQSASLLDVLEKLSPDETRILHVLLKNHGYCAADKALRQSTLGQEEFEYHSLLLTQKNLVFMRKTLTNMKVTVHAYGVYQELYEYLHSLICIDKSVVRERFKAFRGKRLSKDLGLSDALARLLELNLGYYHKQALYQLGFKGELEQLFKKHLLRHAVSFSKEFRVFVELELAGNSVTTIEQQQDCRTPRRPSFITSMYYTAYLIKTRGIALTKKETLKHYDHNLLRKYIKDELFLKKVIEFLHLHAFLEIHQLKYVMTQRFTQFLKKDFLQQYAEILSFNQIAKQTLQHIIEHLAEGHFHTDDVLRVFHTEQILSGTPVENEHKISAALEFLLDLGVITCDKEGLILCSLGKELFNQKRIIPEHSKNALSVGNDLSILVYTDRIHEYALHLISLFADLESDHQALHVLHYRITRSSVQRALILGYTCEEFLQHLQDTSPRSISENITYNIRSWAQSLKIAKLRTLHIIEGAQDIIHELEHHHLIHKNTHTLDWNTILCVNTHEIPLYIESEHTSILLIPEDEA